MTPLLKWQSDHQIHGRRIRIYTWVLAAGWTCLLAASFGWHYHLHQKQMQAISLAEARAALDRDLLYRSWALRHGGLYVPVSPATPPNPLLSALPERDITTPSGKLLTLLNPAYMTRQVYELANQQAVVTRGHLTSLTPLRPENKPDKWEEQSLKAFEKGISEVSAVQILDGKPHMRLMRPFVTDSSCLDCHGPQGYRQGDIRGGVSVSLPISALRNATRRQVIQEGAIHSLFWILGTSVLFSASRRLAGGASALQQSEALLHRTTDSLHEQALQLEQEITVRQLSEEALLYSSELLQSTIASMEELVFVLDREGVLTTFFQPDRSTRPYLRSEQIVGRHYRETGLPQPLIEQIDTAITTLIQTGTSQSFDFTLNMPKGSRWYSATISLRRDKAGNFAGTTMVCRDITRRKQTELALAESEQRFAIFMEHLPLVVFIKDDHGRFWYANEYLEDLLGAEGLIGRTIEELLPLETASKMSAEDQRALAEGLTLVNDVIRDPLGDDRIFETYRFPIHLPGGTTLLGCIATDVTERTRFSESLALKQRQLEELNGSLERRVGQAVDELRKKDEMLIQQGRLAAMGEMINNIAHQWRQPLNNLGLLVQNLQLTAEAGELTPESLRADVREAMDVLFFMSRTIDDFRNFFRQDKDTTPMPVNCLVRKSLDFVAAVLKSSNIEWRLEGDAEVTATGYPNEFSQVLLNILNNARDILLERDIRQPLIAVKVFSEQGRAVITVRDNAGGIPAEVLPRIFDPYFTTKEPGKGTGIGLYMSKVIIEKHMNGSLTASNVGEGAEFRIDL